MIKNKKGFLYPKANPQKCVDCGLCDRVCPISSRKMTIPNIDRIPEGLAFRHSNQDILRSSSSGGAFTYITDFVFEHSGVVYGAIYDENLMVIHKRASNREECKAFMGSKYSQSNLVGIFKSVKDDLRAGLMVLFSGTPCQVDGLKKYLIKPYENLITVDIICHSIPSPLIFREYLKSIEEKYKSKVTNIFMKDKTYGWGAVCVKYVFDSIPSVINPKGLASWVNIFESGYITRECCFDCQYANLDRPSDFTIGDFWDFEKKRPEIYSKDGTSVILINTPKANRIFSSLKCKDYVWSLTKDEYMQPRLCVTSERPALYDRFWEEYQLKGFTFVYRKYFHTCRVRMVFNKVFNKIKRNILRK
jgi:coenzyme F420-reducing hydrogenase beta subunit